MLDRTVPEKINNFLELIRFYKPIGFMLLMWPCWFGIAYIENENLNTIKWYIYFFIGSFLMRSAGCIINDLIDINIDAKIKRTSNRPLTSKKISIIEALFLLFFLLLFSIIILIQFNYLAIIFGLLSIPLICIYPLTKRYTHWPQFFLGLVFSWGVLIVSIQFYNQIIFDYFLLYLACLFWTLAYDTIYAYQDRADDIKINIKSTAVLFGDAGHKYVLLFYLVFFSIIGFLGYKSSQSYISLIVIFCALFVMILYLNKWRLDSINSSNHYFRFNNFIGLFCFLFLILF